MLDVNFLNRDNFYLAFKKLRAHFALSNEWYDPIELSTYEANLANNILRLTNKISDGKYSPSKIQPLPFPKKGKAPNEKKIRQYFRISVDDQLVWIAITNIIGEFLEKHMPVWNYGNRLYQPIWFETVNDRQVIRKGSYSNTSSHYYRKWNQSWPIYRRHISMTVKVMGYNQNFKQEYLDDKELKLLEQESLNQYKDYYYLDKTYWPTNDQKYLYWAGLDFKSFYPSINIETVVSNITAALSQNAEVRTDASILLSTISKMLRFPLDTSGWRSVNDLKDKNKCALKSLKTYVGLPTGLLVSGFLANVAMIEVDKQIESYVRKKRSLAVFKYVDDHVILSTSENDLIEFLNFYHQKLKESKSKVTFQPEKTLPVNYYRFQSSSGFQKDAKSSASNTVDIKFPKPLLTQTIQKMSHLNNEEYDLADTEELDKSAADLEHFLLADFPDEEMRRDTRMSFAAMKLCRVANRYSPDFNVLDPILQRIKYIQLTTKDKKLPKKEEQSAKRIILEETIVLQRSIDEQNKIVKRKQERIHELLLEATSQHPDKLKLWKRSIQLCQSTGVDKLDSIFHLIDDIELESNSKQYLYGYCLLVLAECLIETYNYLKSETKSFWRTYTSVEFLRNCHKSDFLASRPRAAFPFVKECLVHYRFVRHFVYYEVYNLPPLVPKLPRRKGLAISRKSLAHLKLPKAKSHEFEDLLWYLLSNISRNEKIALWQSQIMDLELRKCISWSILSLFPRMISLDVFKEMQKTKPRQGGKVRRYISFEHRDFLTDGEGILYEVFEANTSIAKKYKTHYPEIFQRATKIELDYQPLDLWLAEILKQSKKDKWIDVRLSEWSILEIIKQIGTEIKRVINEDSSYANEIYKIHPSNYLIPTSWTHMEKPSLSWQTWRDKVTSETIRLAKPGTFISDFRYFTLKDTWRKDYLWVFQSEFSIVIGLAVLLTKLIAKSFEWPSVTNKLAFIDGVFSQARYSVEAYPISSDTRILLNQIFSKRDINFLTGYSFVSDATDRVTNLTTFIGRITEIQSQLLIHQLTLIDHAARQLTFIDVDKLNESKIIF